MHLTDRYLKSMGVFGGYEEGKLDPNPQVVRVRVRPVGLDTDTLDERFYDVQTIEMTEDRWLILRGRFRTHEIDCMHRSVSIEIASLLGD